MGICYMTQRTQTGALYQPRGVEWGVRWEAGLEGGDTGIPMADSCWMFHRKQQFCKTITIQSKINKMAKKKKKRQGN